MLYYKWTNNTKYNNTLCIYKRVLIDIVIIAILNYLKGYLTKTSIIIKQNDEIFEV